MIIVDKTRTQIKKNRWLTSRRKKGQKLNWNLKWNKFFCEFSFWPKIFVQKNSQKNDIDKRNWLLRTLGWFRLKTTELKSIDFSSDRLYLLKSSPNFCYQSLHLVFFWLILWRIIFHGCGTTTCFVNQLVGTTVCSTVCSRFHE